MGGSFVKNSHVRHRKSTSHVWHLFHNQSQDFSVNNSSSSLSVYFIFNWFCGMVTFTLSKLITLSQNNPLADRQHQGVFHVTDFNKVETLSVSLRTSGWLSFLRTLNCPYWKWLCNGSDINPLQGTVLHFKTFFTKLTNMMNNKKDCHFHNLKWKMLG